MHTIANGLLSGEVPNKYNVKKNYQTTRTGQAANKQPCRQQAAYKPLLSNSKTKARVHKECLLYLAFGMKTGMDNPVHVEVEVIELHAVRVWFGDVNG